MAIIHPKKPTLSHKNAFKFLQKKTCHSAGFIEMIQLRSVLNKKVYNFLRTL